MTLYPSFDYDAEKDRIWPKGEGIKVHSKVFGLAYEDWPDFDRRMKIGVEQIKRLS